MNGYSAFLDPLGKPTTPRKESDFDRDLLQRSRKLTVGLSESLHILANEPSLGLFRLQG